MTTEKERVMHVHDPHESLEARSHLRGQLLTAAAHLMTIHDPKALMNHVVQQIVAITPSVQASVLWLFDRQQGMLRVAALHGPGWEHQREVLNHIQYRVGEGLPGLTLRRGEPQFIHGRARYRDMTGAVHQRNQASMRQFLDALAQDMTALLLPLRIGNEVLGVLELLDLDGMPPLRRADVHDLQMFANLVGGALKHAQFQVQMHADQRRLEVFSAISAAVSTAADLNELMGNVLDIVLSVINAPAGALFLYNPARAVLTMGAHRNLADTYAADHAEFPLAGSSCEDAVRYGQPIRRLLLPDTDEAPLMELGYTSGLHLPLLAGGTVIGAVSVFTKAMLYSRMDVQSLMLIGNLAGFAIANVLLYQASDIERRRLLTVINSIAEGVVLCDGTGQLVMANQTAMALLSIDTLPARQSLSEMIDFHAIRDVDGEPMSLDRLPISRALAGKVFHDERVLVQGENGLDTVLSFSGAPVYGDDNTIEGAVVVFRDITAMQKTERAKDEFLAVAAHELRSPLAAVRSYTDLLVRREQSRSTEGSLEMYGLTVLAQQVSHMLRLVDDLLDVSRLDADQFSLQLQLVDLVALVKQVLEQQRPAAGDRQLQLDSAPAALPIMCDQMRIHQVLTNIVGNAIRYSKPGLRIGVSIDVHRAAALAERHPAFVTCAPHAYEPDMEFAVVAVEDQGIGIPESQREQLFKRYVRGQNRLGKGLGLGLYLSREFVVRHGGSIWFESVVDKGSTFYVALPLSTEAPDEMPLSMEGQ
jgi:two-component system phosphate regulon sensor histidine kinase PhoR